ncbi:MAG: phage major capsid protein [bacterium]|nr:phage major capsid protein [bacterium]
MNKKMRELFAKIQAKTVELRTALSEKSLDKAEEVKKEIDELAHEYNLEKAAFETEKNINAPGLKDLGGPEGEPADDKKKGTGGIKAFADAARRHFKSMNETTGADGGYVVPQDIQTQIEQIRDTKFSLRERVRVIPTTTNKGQRPVKKRVQLTGFTKIGEGGKIGEAQTPQFKLISYTIGKYSGIIPVTNELLEDSDAAIASVLTEWLGDEARVTENKAIIAAAKGIGTTAAISTLDDIKKILNVSLGQAFLPTSSIITNDDGANWLDTLKDENGRYLLSPDPTNPKQLRLSVGAYTVPVDVISNADMPTTEKKVPFIIGDMNEAIIMFDRRQITIDVSKEATIGDLNLFENDMTAFRAIERFDVQVRDDGAVVYGELTLS